MVAAPVGTPLVTTVVGGVVVVSTTEVDEGCVVAGGSRLLFFLYFLILYSYSLIFLLVFNVLISRFNDLVYLSSNYISC